MADLCIHEMIVGTCGLCAEQAASREHPASSDGPHFRRAGGPLMAQYESRCPECHDMIEPGEEIVKDPRTDLYVHEGCA